MKAALEFMRRGELVPDTTVWEMVRERSHCLINCGGFILDGFPRTIPQAEALMILLQKLAIKLDTVINIDVPKAVILDRLTTRRTCSNPDCQEIYNVKSKPASPDGKCLKCGSPVVQRADETEEAITIRLATYNEKTAPLIDFYKKEGLLKTVSSLSSEEIVKEIIRGVK